VGFPAPARVVVARDRMGIKPLYIARMRGLVAFASEIKAFLALPQWTGDVDAEKVPEYLVYRDVAGKGTLFRDVERVLPGQMLVIDADGRETAHTYWSMPLPRSSQNGDARHHTIEGWCDELDRLLDEVVRVHLLSDVPLGTFNSGGVDSSLVTAYTARAIDRPSTRTPSRSTIRVTTRVATRASSRNGTARRITRTRSTSTNSPTSCRAPSGISTSRSTIRTRSPSPS
jgi:asparagine synthetase B (glutamine-hydrolysing)